MPTKSRFDDVPAGGQRTRRARRDAKRITLLGACVVAMLASSAVVTATAPAAKFRGFTQRLVTNWDEAPQWLRNGKAYIVCSGSGGGEAWLGTHPRELERVTNSITSCRSQVTGLLCTSVGAAEGEIKLEPQTEELVGEGGLEMRPTSEAPGALFARFTCGGTEEVEITGSVIGSITPISTIVPATGHFTYTLAVVGRKQADGGSLQIQVNKGGFTESAMRGADTLILERTLEISTSTTPPHYYSGLGAGTILTEGVRTPVVGFGTLSLTNVTGGTGSKVTCHNVVGGWVENPKGEAPETGHTGPEGIGETQAFGAYECESAACKSGSPGGPATYISVMAEPTVFTSPAALGGNAAALGWKSSLYNDALASSQPRIRSESEGVKVDVICHVNTGVTNVGGTGPTEPVYGVAFSQEHYEGEIRPWTGNDRAAVMPALNLTEFDVASPSNGQGSGALHGPGTEVGRTARIEGALEVVQYNGPKVVNTKSG